MTFPNEETMIDNSIALRRLATRATLAAGISLAALAAHAQSVTPGSAPTWHSVALTTNNQTFTVPANVTSPIYVDGCGVGGSGAGGQASANTAGGGGGGAAECVKQFPIGAVAGSVITATIPTPPTGGNAGANGTAGANASISWTTPTDTGFLRLFGGDRGLVGSAGVGGAGAASSWSAAGIGGQAGAAAGAAGVGFISTSVTTVGFQALVFDGTGGGGGGSTAGTAGAGGYFPHTALRQLAGTGNGAGGGGGNSFGGFGQPGTANGVACSASPTWVGFGGGGCGGGTNAAGGPGGPAVFTVWYQQ